MTKSANNSTVTSMFNTTAYSSVTPNRPTDSGVTPSASESIRIGSGPAWQPALPSITGPR